MCFPLSRNWKFKYYFDELRALQEEIFIICILCTNTSVSREIFPRYRNEFSSVTQNRKVQMSHTDHLKELYSKWKITLFSE